MKTSGANDHCLSHAGAVAVLGPPLHYAFLGWLLTSNYIFNPLKSYKTLCCLEVFMRAGGGTGLVAQSRVLWQCVYVTAGVIWASLSLLCIS